VRGLNGWCAEDTWSWFSYQTKVNIEALEDFKRYLHGYPCGQNEEGAEQKWDDIIQKIIDGFKAIREIEECEWVDLPNSKERLSELEKIRDEGLSLYAKWFKHLWD
jgi:hypothetical protein